MLADYRTYPPSQAGLGFQSTQWFGHGRLRDDPRCCAAVQATG